MANPCYPASAKGAELPKGGSALRGGRPDLLIFDDVVSTRESDMMENAVNVSGQTLHDVKMKISEPSHRPYLTIEPIDGRNFDSDERAPRSRAIPAEKFRVTWIGFGESFVREVTGEKELFAVLKPIVGANLASMKALEKHRAEGKKKVLERDRAAIREKIAMHKRNEAASIAAQKELEDQLDELS